MLDLIALAEAVGELDEDKVMSMLEAFVAENPSEEEAQKAVAACQEGMNIVGDLFEQEEYFVGDLIFAGELLTNAINTLKPLLGGAATGGDAGVLVLGTVAGDLHDIGKNIYKNMMEAAGFVVPDLGIDQTASAFVEKAK